MITNKELKQQVKEALKADGFNTSTKEMSIKIKSIGYGDMYIDVILKSFINNIKEVRNVLLKFQDIEYDHNGCGDTLQGSNTFVNVKYDYAFLESSIHRYYDEANMIINNTKSEGNNGKLIKQSQDKKMYYCKDLGICSFDDKQHNAKNTYELANCLLNFALS